MFQIPVQDMNDQVLQLSFSGNDYNLRLKWNATCNMWTADTSDSAGIALLTGFSICPQRALFLPMRSDALPLGYIICIAPDRRDTLSYSDLVSGTVQLLYVEPSDILAA